MQQCYAEQNVFHFGVCSYRNGSTFKSSATKTQVDKKCTVYAGTDSGNERLEQAETAPYEYYCLSTMLRLE